MVHPQRTFTLGFWLVLSALPCQVWSDDPTPTVQPGIAQLQALSTPSAPPPANAPALSKDDAALVAEVNGLYYNYKRQGLHKFKCEIKISMFDNMVAALKGQVSSDDPKYIALKDVQFFMSYDEKNGMKFTYSNYKPTGDANTDASLSKMMDGVQQIVNGFWESWKGLSFELPIDPSKSTVTVKKTGDGYEIDETRDKLVTTNFLNADLLVTEADGRKVGGQDMVMSLKPLFLKDPNGYLLSSMVVDVPKVVNETFSLSYQTVDKYQLPATCDLLINVLGTQKADVTLTFSDFKLN